MEIEVDQESYGVQIEEGFRVKEYSWFMREKVLRLLEKRARYIDQLFHEGKAKIRTLVVKDNNEEVIVFPFVKRNGKRESIQGLIQTQDYRWYCSGIYLGVLIKLCEQYEIDVIGINVYTGKKGKEVAVVDSDSVTEYINQLDNGLRVQMENIRDRYFRLFKWDFMHIEGKWKELARENVEIWSKDLEDSELKEKYINNYIELMESIVLTGNAFIMGGIAFGELVGGFLFLRDRDTDKYHSLLAFRNRAFRGISTGHLLQLAKVSFCTITGKKLDLGGSLDVYPHKRRWATKIERTGAIGIGYY